MKNGDPIPLHPLNSLRLHLDSAARTLRDADPAPFTVVIVELIPLTGSELDYRIVGTDPVTVIAFEAVAA